MSLVTSAVFPVLADVPAPRAPHSYTLTRRDGGWTLLAHREAGPPAGSATPLAPHGAGPDASQRVAQAVGVRVLHGLGVDVTGWGPAPDGAPTDVVARLGPAPRGRRRGLRGHGNHGH